MQKGSYSQIFQLLIMVTVFLNIYSDKIGMAVFL